VFDEPISVCFEEIVQWFWYMLNRNIYNFPMRRKSPADRERAKKKRKETPKAWRSVGESLFVKVLNEPMRPAQ
jgi:hypothetical protein